VKSRNSRTVRRIHRAIPQVSQSFEPRRPYRRVDAFRKRTDAATPLSQTLQRFVACPREGGGFHASTRPSAAPGHRSRFLTQRRWERGGRQITSDKRRETIPSTDSRRWTRIRYCFTRYETQDTDYPPQRTTETTEYTVAWSDDNDSRPVKRFFPSDILPLPQHILPCPVGTRFSHARFPASNPCGKRWLPFYRRWGSHDARILCYPNRHIQVKLPHGRSRGSRRHAGQLAAASQSSTVTPSIRQNSLVLCVTRVSVQQLRADDRTEGDLSRWRVFKLPPNAVGLAVQIPDAHVRIKQVLHFMASRLS
jgi:hypothetical protein